MHKFATKWPGRRSSPSWASRSGSKSTSTAASTTPIRKLVGKVRNEISHEIDTAKIEPRLAAMRENYRLVRDRLSQIVWWKPEDGGKPPLNRDVNEAAKNIVMMDLAILQAEAAAGMYKKPVEELAKEVRYDPLPPEVRTVVIAAWSRGGFLPKAAVEQMVPLIYPKEGETTRL